jgi:hypothetical protein
MHRCLRISEILRLICDELRLCQANRELARLARTCRALSDIPLDALWYHLQDLMLLIRCMPSDLWKWDSQTRRFILVNIILISPPTFLLIHLVKLRGIMDSDWLRVHIYSWRVYSFFTSDFALFRAELEDVKALFSANPSSAFFPNLRELVWITVPSVFPIIHSVLGPKTYKLLLTFCPELRYPLSILSALPSRYPNLTDVRLRIIGDGSDAVIQSHYERTIETTLCSWTGLRALDIENPPKKPLGCITALPSLYRLTLSYPRGRPTRIPSWKNTNDCFPSLTMLAIIAVDCTPILAAMPTIPALNTLQLGTERVPSASAIRIPSESAIHDSHSDSVLKIMAYGEAGRNEKRLDMIFPNLTHVILNSVRVDDEGVKQMAMAWRCIISLRLGMPERPWGNSRMTLVGMVALAQHCPQLRHLSVPIDACEVPSTSPDTRIFVNSLVELEVGNSPIIDPVEVGAFLSRLFPKLRRIGSCGPCKVEWEEAQLTLSQHIRHVCDQLV